MHGHQGKPPVEVDYESILQSFLESFKLTEVESSKKTDGDKDLVGRILLAYDLLRRKMSQIQEMSDPFPGSVRCPDLKAGTMLMTKGIRTNQTKRVGNVPGIEVDDPISVSIVSSGGYDDEGDDGEVLIYSGQGGVQRRWYGQMFGQKLERGNLALEKSLHCSNEEVCGLLLIGTL
ncbi:unnamed protein product [Cuscuta campestris]|uniref:YDG domain-containing protein n=1 Tax=Cuscuta campestris TaxID=132261 RepID=A0A484M3V2_9ASTE|nr:unnamed protein product [Cuscuta campestris]